MLLNCTNQKMLKSRAFLCCVVWIGVVSLQFGQHLPISEAFVKEPTASRKLTDVHAPCCFEAVSASPSNTAENERTLDLASYFKDEYQGAASRLSSTSIVDMVTPESSSISATDSPDSNSNNNKPLRQQFFTSPLISVLYERVASVAAALGGRASDRWTRSRI